MGRFNKLSYDDRELFKKIYREICNGSRFSQCEGFISHGTTTVRTHVINVTKVALILANIFNIDVHKEKLIRGALLHDYYLYDWHEKKLKELHGFRHPRKALKEALVEYDLSEIEKDIIIHHMFPLTFNIPKSREARLICIADKICAWGETVDGKLLWLGV